VPDSVFPAAPPTTTAALARAFLVETEADPRPWPDLFQGWADGRDLDGAERFDVKVAVIRARAFGARKCRRRAR
jgi:hypothetical protein